MITDLKREVSMATNVVSAIIAHTENELAHSETVFSKAFNEGYLAAMKHQGNTLKDIQSKLTELENQLSNQKT